MKKTLRDQLNTAAKKYAAGNDGGNEQTENAYIEGAKWWMRNAAKTLVQYEKDLNEAVAARFGRVEPWLRLQISKTARLWHTRDRIAAELDMADTMQVWGQGSTKQVTVTFDQRAIELRKYDESLTKDLTALGLNFNTMSNKISDDPRQQQDGLKNLLSQARDNMTDIPDM